ncbi:MAG: tetraacyldisaccharide 4'-kinase [Gemmatimonadaceae bacterium]
MIDFAGIIETVWRGRGLRARAARSALMPFELLYRGVVGLRGALYDTGLVRVENFSVPVLSVGNLSVGGTGKTPVSAWIAHRLAERGAKPGIVLRGYGGDETLVHERLNPGAPVIVASDRARGIREAIAQGVDIVVLDDAYQHRRASRDADVLLLDADSWTGTARLLPAGPWREPLSAARRANLIIVTRKIATPIAVDEVRKAISSAAPGVPIAVAQLAPADLRSTSTGQGLPLHVLRGSDLMAIAAVARPESFFRQLTELGAVVRPHSFPDHHSFTPREANYLAAQSGSSDFVVCTLKDAVKLETIWPPEAGSLWYVSQRLKIEDGEPQIDRLLDTLLSVSR